VTCSYRSVGDPPTLIRDVIGDLSLLAVIGAWATRPHRSAVAAKKKEGESPSLLWVHPDALAGDVDNGDGISVPSRIALGRAPWR
jgi:hypothetical protein